jgi:hypothetical protein
MVRKRGWTGGEQHSEKGGGECMRQGDWVAEGLVSATKTTSIHCILCNKKDVNPLYPPRLRIEGEDYPVTTSSYLSPLSSTFVFVALGKTELVVELA